MRSFSKRDGHSRTHGIGPPQLTRIGQLDIVESIRVLQCLEVPELKQHLRHLEFLHPNAGA